MGKVEKQKKDIAERTFRPQGQKKFFCQANVFLDDTFISVFFQIFSQAIFIFFNMVVMAVNNLIYYVATLQGILSVWEKLETVLKVK